MIRRSAALTGVVLLGMALPSSAQEPFSVIELQGQWSSDISRAPLHQHWAPGRGAVFNVVMPFYAGDFEFGGAVHRYATRSDAPGFAALWLYAGWGVHYQWRERLTAYGTARLGNYRMSFDGAEDRYTGVSAESELALGVGGGLSLLVADPVSVYVRVDRLRVETLPVLNLWYVSGGLSVRIRAGAGWKAFFE